jgi:hypothetical protein
MWTDIRESRISVSPRSLLLARPSLSSSRHSSKICRHGQCRLLRGWMNHLRKLGLALFVFLGLGLLSGKPSGPRRAGLHRRSASALSLLTEAAYPSPDIR